MKCSACRRRRTSASPASASRSLAYWRSSSSSQAVQHLDRGQGGVGADRAHRVEPGRAGEHGQPVEQHPLGRRQPLVAAVDRGPQRALAPGQEPRRAGQHAQRVAQLPGDLLGGQRRQPAGGQLDRQRDAVGQLTDPGDGGGVVRGQREAGLERPGAGQEQLHGLEAEQVLRRRRVLRPRRGERGQAPGQLARDAQRLPAGRQQVDVRAGEEEGGSQLRARLGQVLAVVEHEQDPLVADRLDQAGHDAGVGPLAHGERRGQAARHQLGVRHVRQLRQEDAVRVRADHVLGHGQRQAGLARSAGAAQRDQAVAVQRLAHPRSLALPTDERRQLSGQPHRAAESHAGGL